jgi:hypothetical protein
MDGKEAAVFIDIAAHHFEKVLLFKTGANIFQAVLYRGAFAFIARFGRKLVQGFQIAYLDAEFLPRLVTVFKAFQFGHGFFRRLGVVPETGFGGFRLKIGYPSLKRVKAASMFREF